MDQDLRTVWCGNLSDKVTEDLLYELFLQAGPVQRVSIPTDKDGRQKSFGFVTYKDEVSVPYALALFDGTKLFNRPLNLKSRNPRGTDLMDQRSPMISRNIRPMDGLDGRGLPMKGHHMGLSLPANLSQQTAVATATAINDFNMLLQLGQQMLMPGAGMVPFPMLPNMGSPLPPNMGSPLPVYSSQMGGNNYLGGSSHGSKEGGRSYSSRNHPYSQGGKGSKGSDRSPNSRHKDDRGLNSRDHTPISRHNGNSRHSDDWRQRRGRY